MDDADWMNEQVRQEIEDLQRTYGFEEQEAIAFWHLGQVRPLMDEMWRTDSLAWRYLA